MRRLRRRNGAHATTQHESILVGSLFSSPSSLILSNLVGVLVMLMSWQWTGDHAFYTLSCLTIVVLLGRMATLVRYRLAEHGNENRQALRRWDIEFQIGATLFAGLQGASCYHAIAGTQSAAVQILNVIAAVAFASGYVARNAGRPKYVIVQVLCLCVPLMMALEQSQQEFYSFISLFIVLYMLTNVVIVLSLHRNLSALADATAEAQENEASSRKHAEQAHLALRSMTHGLVTFDETLTRELQNERHGELYGVWNDPAATTLDGMLDAAVKIRSLSHGDATLIRQDVARMLKDQRAVVREIATPANRTLLLHVEPTANGGILILSEDITERKQIQQKIETMARTDPLTGLANRHELDRMLASIGPVLKHGIHSVAILYIDLDDFKTINDSLGHGIGDKVLVAIADRIQESVRITDFLARFGGDEFIAIMPSTDVELAMTVAHQVLKSLDAPIIVGARKFSVSASVGVAVGPEHGPDGSNLMTAADLALYESKSTGKGRARVFSPDMAATFRRRTELERDMRDGLANGAFELNYQPIVDIRDGRVTAVEALLRWNHPTKGRISPNEFIPIAERSDLICDLGEWVLRRAAQDHARLPDGIAISVNVSPKQFQQPERLVATIREIIAAEQLAASRLELELTESVLVEDPEQTLETMTELRGLGVCFALDDFGTGYSSIGYLATYAFDKVKIDRTFASVVGSNAASRSVVEMVQLLAERIGFAVVAEGLEDTAQIEAIAATGITLVQGYYFSPPIPLDDLECRLAGTGTLSIACA
ncbi:EAL domain-containing protein [Jiella sp. MQZ9-1]|uniref:EAL domain-containing protein n=1 Tax=Jiella flava TaxID=2816857 RepID=A0A939FXD6_9HYPH|nr:EAL domain-containing protein [Jiella flava]MBO0661915.1 EAL domain-containing protein [Jiella flava]MCD2470757.1 EAL domain-containing protein [Jiella flava]